MSHLTTYTNNSLVNTNKEMLGTALQELGITLDYVNNTIKNTWINEKVDAAIIYRGKRIAVGLNFVDVNGEETVEVSGDFYGTGIKQEELTNSIAQIYQKHSVVNKCTQQGWYVENTNVNEDGEIEITAYRYA